MTHVNLKMLTAAAVLVVGASPALSQSAMTSVQCENMMMVGTQNFAPAAVAGCTAFFQSLADGAIATGTFATVRPQVGVVLSTSGTGG